jgi:hypothetical protein
MSDTYTVVIIKNMDSPLVNKLTLNQLRKLRETINSFPDTEDGLKIKLAFADAFIDALNQIDSKEIKG